MKPNANPTCWEDWLAFGFLVAHFFWTSIAAHGMRRGSYLIEFVGRAVPAVALVESARGGYPMATNSSSWDEINPLDLRRSSKSTNHHFCVDKAVATGTWAIGVLHHVRPEYGGPTVEEFRDLADYVADLRDRRDLWVGTVRGIACYIRKRWALTVNSSFDTETATISVTAGSV